MSAKENTNRKIKKEERKIEKNTDRTQTKLKAPQDRDDVKIWYGKTRVTSYELRNASGELKAQKHKLNFKSANSNPGITISNQQAKESFNQWKLK